MLPRESLQRKLDRVRLREPVPIPKTYDVGTAGGMIKKALPFVVGVLADLAGHRDPDAEPPPGLESPRRRFVDIHRDNFDQVMSDIRPRLALHVPNELRKDGTQIAVELQFRGIADFEPVHVVRQVDPLRKLLEARQRLADFRTRISNNDRLEFTRTDSVVRPDHRDLVGQFIAEIVSRESTGPDDILPMLDDRIAALDRLLSDQLNAILHDPAFQKLEASWRGLRYLVSESETGEPLQIRVLDVSKDELLRDLEHARELDRSGLFEKVYAAEYEVLDGTPYAVLIGDFEFGRHPRDIGLLGLIARVAAAAHAPFVAGASPELFHFESLTELANRRDLTQIFEGVEYAPWNAFRASEDSRYVALCLPRILMREPYGDARPVEEFRFEEDVAGPNDKKYLWGNAAYALGARITDAVAMHGWCTRICGIRAGGRVFGLACHPLTTGEGEIAVKRSTEIIISDRRESELASLGFIALISYGNTDDAAFVSAPSCHKPARYQVTSATAVAFLSAELPGILTTCQFVQCLKVMARDNIGSFMEVGDCATWLNDWIQNYVVPNPELVGEEIKARCPLADARIDVRAVVGKPVWYEVVAYLRMHHQLETPSASMRLVAEVPKLR